MKSASVSKGPSFKPPMLARLSKKIFSDKGWIFERKFDGIRVLILKKNKRVTVYSRNKKVLNKTFPEMVSWFEKMRVDNFLVDGELVSLKKGLSNFSKLQPRINRKLFDPDSKQNVKETLFLFDILHLNQKKLTSLSVLERKTILKKTIPFNSNIRWTSHRRTNGEAYFNYAKQKGWENILAKKSDSTYLSKRSSNWLKFKCTNEEEMIVCGYTKPQKSRNGFGALLIGYYKQGELQYAGKVGTGFSEVFLNTFSKKLKAIERISSPFKDKKVLVKGAIWVSPKYVCQVGFTEWTRDGKLRHPSFLGLR